MKFIWFKQFLSFDQRSASEKNLEKLANGRVKVFQQVVTFEDCVEINKSFVEQNMETTSVRNQYLAAAAGLRIYQKVSSRIFKYLISFSQHNCYRSWCFYRLGFTHPTSPSDRCLNTFRDIVFRRCFVGWQYASSRGAFWNFIIWMAVRENWQVLGNFNDNNTTDCKNCFNLKSFWCQFVN